MSSNFFRKMQWCCCLTFSTALVVCDDDLERQYTRLPKVATVSNQKLTLGSWWVLSTLRFHRSWRISSLNVTSSFPFSPSINVLDWPKAPKAWLGNLFMTLDHDHRASLHSQRSLVMHFLKDHSLVCSDCCSVGCFLCHLHQQRTKIHSSSLISIQCQFLLFTSKRVISLIYFTLKTVIYAWHI